MKNIVVIGGGTGQSVIVRGLKDFENINLTAIVTVADDGGSTGRLREMFNLPAMGDIRNVMSAMAEEESIVKDLINYRFEGEGDIAGHNLGNLMLTALAQQTGNFIESIRLMSKVVKIKGRILPSTLEYVTLYAEMQDGTIVRGESNIPKFEDHIKRVFYEDEVCAYRDAMLAIRHADVIVFGIGSLYTSVLPNVIIPKLKRELENSNAKKIYIANAMTQMGETNGFTVEDHVTVLENHLTPGIIDTVVCASTPISKELLEKYEQEESFPVELVKDTHSYRVLEEDILDVSHGYIRHDSDKLKKVLEKLINEG